jgi:hypothetical protein
MHEQHLLSTESNSGLTVNSPDENGYTALHAAVSWGHADLLRMLVSEYNGDINIADNDGDTPLFTVETLEMCKLVLELGGDPTLIDKEGLSPARFLLDDDHEDIARYLASLTGEELPAVASTSEVPMGADDDANADEQSHPQQQQQLDMTTAQRILDSRTAEADLASLDPASRQAAIETNNRAGTLLSQVQEILLEAERTGEDPEQRIRAVVDQAVRGTMIAGRQMAEMQVSQQEMGSNTQEQGEQQQQQQQHQVYQTELDDSSNTKRQRTDDQPER